MLNESVIEKIIKELKSTLLNYDIRKMLRNYEHLLDLPVDLKAVQGLQHDLTYVINCFYGNERKNDDDLKLYFKSFISIEALMKKLLYIVSEQKYNELEKSKNATLAPLLTELGALESIKNGKGFPNLSAARPEQYINNPYQMEHIIRSYKVRNTEYHEAKEWSEIELLINARSVMIASIWIAWKYKIIIEKLYSESVKNTSTDAEKLAIRIITEYEMNEKNGFRFVPVKWQRKSSSDQSDCQISSMQTIREDIDGEKRLLLIGEAGCGKSTSIDFLEYQDAKAYLKDRSKPIPIKVKFINVVDIWTTLEDEIARQLDISTDYCISLLTQGAINIYLDGLNEIIVSQEIKKKIAMQIEAFLKDYCSTFLLLTDRNDTTIQVSSSFLVYKLIEMDRYEIENYLQVRTNNSNVITDKILKFYDKANISHLKYTPLLLEMLVEIAQDNDSMPDTSSDFIKVYIRSLINREYREKKDTNAASGRLFNLLSYLSLDMEEKKVMSQTEILRNFKFCTESLGIEADTLNCLNLALQLGILKCEDERYSFYSEEYLYCFWAEAAGQNMEEWRIQQYHSY